MFYHANQIMPCRYQRWLNILIQLAKHCRLYFIKKKPHCQKAQHYASNSPPSPSRYFADVGTSLMQKQIRPSPRWTEQVKAEGSVLILLCASVRFSGLLNKCWLRKARCHLQTRARLVTGPAGCVKARM